jgi:hypothetical protein
MIPVIIPQANPQSALYKGQAPYKGQKFSQEVGFWGTVAWEGN